jgi:alkylated DNA repair protein alkB family protein 8
MMTASRQTTIDLTKRLKVVNGQSTHRAATSTEAAVATLTFSEHKINHQKQVKLPPGAYLIEEFISVEEEKELLALTEENKWDDTLLRPTQHYGYTYDYNSPSTPPSSTSTLPIPPLMKEKVIDRLAALTITSAGFTNGIFKPFSAESGDDAQGAGGDGAPDQVIVNKYNPGQGIGAHTDHETHFRGSIATLSMGSEYSMNLIPHTPASGIKCPQAPRVPRAPKTAGGAKRKVGDATPQFEAGLTLFALEKKRVEIRLPRRSVLILTGESRYLWDHEIKKKKTDRVDGKIVKRGVRTSITVRVVSRPNGPIGPIGPFVIKVTPPPREASSLSLLADVAEQAVRL